MLENEGAHVKAYDPQSMELVGKVDKRIELCENAYEVAKDADALVLATMWNEFKQIDFERIKSAMKQPVLIDGRNLYDPDTMKALGFIYHGVGRGN